MNFINLRCENVECARGNESATDLPLVLRSGRRSVTYFP